MSAWMLPRLHYFCLFYHKIWCYISFLSDLTFIHFIHFLCVCQIQNKITNEIMRTCCNEYLYWLFELFIKTVFRPPFYSSSVLTKGQLWLFYSYFILWLVLPKGCCIFWKYKMFLLITVIPIKLCFELSLVKRASVLSVSLCKHMQAEKQSFNR